MLCDEMHKNTAGLHYDGTDNTGKRIIIDVAEIKPGRYEVMAMRPNGHEIESFWSSDLDYITGLYAEYLDRYTKTPEPSALTGKYAKLRDDLKAAVAAGKAAGALVDDGGTCNCDNPALHLPRWNRALVEQAAEEAGVGCSVWNLYGTKYFVFWCRFPGQAYKNEIAAEAATKALSEMGYDATCYQQMD